LSRPAAHLRYAHGRPGRPHARAPGDDGPPRLQDHADLRRLRAERARGRVGRAGIPSAERRTARRGGGAMRPPVVELTAHAVVAEMVVFRIVRGASPQDPEVVAGFHSNYHRGFDPRGAEVANALVHMGLSTYRTSERAAA